MNNVTLESLEAGIALKAALDKAKLMFGLADVKGMVNSWLKVNDKGISQIQEILSADEVDNIEMFDEDDGLEGYRQVAQEVL